MNVRSTDVPSITMERRASITWAQRLKRVFNIDIEICRACGGAIRAIVCIEGPVVIEKILTHLKEKATSKKRVIENSRPTPEHRLYSVNMVAGIQCMIHVR